MMAQPRGKAPVARMARAGSGIASMRSAGARGGFADEDAAIIRRRALDVARLDPSKGLLTAMLKRAGWTDGSC
jgi:hypothetical protein